MYGLPFIRIPFPEGHTTVLGDFSASASEQTKGMSTHIYTETHTHTHTHTVPSNSKPYLKMTQGCE